MHYCKKIIRNKPFRRGEADEGSHLLEACCNQAQSTCGPHGRGA